MRFRSLAIAITFHCSSLSIFAQHQFNSSYSGKNADHIAFPIGGIGAGMFCIEGAGAISHMSIKHNPDMFNEPAMFAAISIKQIPNSARVLEGPVPDWKKFGGVINGGGGVGGTTYGLARFAKSSFGAKFPFAEINLSDKQLPVTVTIKAWSPFIPNDADNSSLPVGSLEYHFKNTGTKKLDYTFSYNSKNFLIGAGQSIKPMQGGFILNQYLNPQNQAAFAIYTNESNASMDYCWFRGGWWDPVTMAWQKIENNDVSGIAPVEKEAPGASLYVPFTLKPGEEKTIRIMMAWYVPNSNLRTGFDAKIPSDSSVTDLSATLPSKYYKPWYSSKFKSIEDVTNYWRLNYDSLQLTTHNFTTAFYNTTLPPEVVEAVAANLTILKSPTVMRQYDGRFWGWEGCNDDKGSCAGSCTHVYNYAQSLPNLFPALERSIRETEFNESMDIFGHQNYRATLPVRPAAHNYYLPAADGQLGSIMRAYRDWRISGDGEWIKKLYPKIKISMDYCINQWDPRHKGVLEEPHHNTYDIEFWGADPMCTSIYLGALEAIIEIGKYAGDDTSDYESLLTKGKSYVETNLFNGEHYFQNIQWRGLRTQDPIKFAGDIDDNGEAYSPEAKLLLQKEGPKYQYGNGCLSDGIIGCWEAQLYGLSLPFNKDKIASHLSSVYKYNYKTDLSTHSNPQRPGFALGNEGGLLLCTWPKGGKLSLPFVYSNEVWTGVEYEVASHLIFMGKVKEGLNIVKTLGKRYDGLVRNPFDEYEAGHWYARAMSSYALLQALTGVRYDAVDKTLYIDSKVDDFTTFLSTTTGFGNVTYKNGKVSLKIVSGSIQVTKIIIAGKIF